MSTTATSITVDFTQAVGCVEQALANAGATPREREIVTDVLLAADLRGQHSHGVMRLPTIIGRVRAGLIRPGAEPHVDQVAPGVSMVDAAMGFGHVTALDAVELACDLARASGIALVGIRNNNHIGMLGYYCDEAARAGFITILSTTTEPMVHPHGGSDRVLGTNPIAIGIPANPDPFVLDASTSMTAIGKILDRAQRGEPIPADWALDQEGAATTDPTAALAGSINPFGGAKGYGLGLAMALLAGTLLDTAPNPEVVGTLDTSFPANKGDLVIAIDPGVFPRGSTFAQRSASLLDTVRASRPAPGSERVLVPGDRGRLERQRALQDGVDLPVDLWRRIEDLALRAA